MPGRKGMESTNRGQETVTVEEVRFGRPSKFQASPSRVPSLPVPCFLTLNELARPVEIAWLVNALPLATR